jgi:predicted DNA-binding transcriptional regulator AlpA
MQPAGARSNSPLPAIEGDMTAQTQITETVATVPVLWTPRQAAEYTGKSESWFENDRWRGGKDMIPYVKLGRAVRYRAADIVAYVEANTHGAAA